MYNAADVGEGRHPRIVVESLGIRYERAIPQSIADQWWFLGCVVPNGTEIPTYLTIMELSDEERKHWMKSSKFLEVNDE